MTAFGDALVYLNDPFNWTRTGGILDLLVQHLRISALAVLLAAVLAIPIGILLGRSGGGVGAVVVLSNVSRAVPTATITFAISESPIRGHSVEVVEASMSALGRENAIKTGMALALGAVDILSDPAILEAARRSSR